MGLQTIDRLRRVIRDWILRSPMSPVRPHYCRCDSREPLPKENHLVRGFTAWHQFAVDYFRHTFRNFIINIEL